MIKYGFLRAIVATVACLSFVLAAHAECSVADIERCTKMDPAVAERLLLIDVESSANQESLYRIGRFYWTAPEVFRDLIRAEWYLGRSADLGYQPAVTDLEALRQIVAGEALGSPEEGKPEAGNLGSDFALADPPSFLGGRQLTVDDILKLAYDAGFRSEEQLLAVTAMGIAESALWTQARNWKPEQGFRPSTDVIGVTGPPEVWKEGRQMHSDRGLWQVSSLSWSRYPDRVTDDPGAAAEITFVVSKQGTDFSLWDSFLSGRAQRHYDRPLGGWPALRPLVSTFLADASRLSDARL